ncbi:RNA polymerase sigma factor [Pelagicoccus sp. SDUM812003]|uniref:RNA polymerase sigma factor n=1 Tax=Pelagicoccus sp. SDUM812003 TaxID=3041267 RepID=UPI00280EABB0|nr:RNA polymerase sigma factor [Pelagicoccus sp. SDUM812003]MDQ8205377.1 RNA polymerase sigma factor [Pelagicoccus sp. SDUM812003]
MPPELKTIVDDHYQNLYRFAYSLTRSSDDAWDLTQEAFLRLAQKRSSIRSASAIKSWLYTTLYREFIRVAKKAKRFDPWEEHESTAQPSDTSLNQIRKAEANDLLDALGRLKTGYRQVVALYYLESYSYKQISEILDIPIGTVMSRLSRGKDMLKAEIQAPNASRNERLVPFSSPKQRPSNG